VSEWFLAWLSVVVSVPAGRWKVKPKGNSKNFGNESMNKEITKSKDWRQFWNLEGFRLSGVIG
jgi:hypothetical protein